MKEASDMYTQNSNSVSTDFLEMQLSYSTADIEKSIFYTAEAPTQSPEAPDQPAMMLVVNGEIFQLEESRQPEGTPLQDASGLFRIVGIVEHR
jgi:hypothetical protein